uniref:C-type lectin domain-containing protein n=1 Tax=Hucho hucho TaxID=62062 RepID=A0A4W5RYD2_9TELE
MLVCSPQGCPSSPHNVGLFSTGLSILPSYLPHQFHFVNMDKNWTEAQSICRLNYTDLATIDDMADMRKLSNTVSATAWIGLYLSRWRWTLGDRELEGEGFWASGQPNNENKELCVRMSQDGLWRDDNCDKDWYFVCYDNTATDKYILIKTFHEWRDAQSYCQNTIHTDLVSVRNATERDAILEKVKTDIQPTARTDKYSVWIGLHTFPGVWRKSDQSVSPFENWKTGEPKWEKGELCCEVNFPSGTWNGQGCTTKLPFICYDGETLTKTRGCN